MRAKLKPTHSQPGGFIEEDPEVEEVIVNDSLGTVESADSTGSDEEKETGDAKELNKNTKED